MRLFITALCLAMGATAVNNRLKEAFSWKTVEFVFPNDEGRAEAIKSGNFKPENNLPLGLDVWKNKLFITVPRWKSGVPSSLNYIDISDLNITSVIPEEDDDNEESPGEEPPEPPDNDSDDNGLLGGVGDLVTGDDGVLGTLDDVTDGVGDLVAGDDGVLSTVDDLTAPLLGENSTLADGVGDLVAGDDGVLGTLDDVTDGVGDLVAGDDGVLGAVDDLTAPLLGENSTLADGVGDLVAGDDGVLGTLGDATDGVGDLVAGDDGVLSAVDDVTGPLLGENATLADGIGDLVTGDDGVLGTLGNATDGVGDLVAGDDGVLSAVDDVTGPLLGENATLADGVGDLVAGDDGVLGTLGNATDGVGDLVAGDDGVLSAVDNATAPALGDNATLPDGVGDLVPADAGILDTVGSPPAELAGADDTPEEEEGEEEEEDDDDDDDDEDEKEDEKPESRLNNIAILRVIRPIGRGNVTRSKKEALTYADRARSTSKRQRKEYEGKRNSTLTNRAETKPKKQSKVNSSKVSAKPLKAVKNDQGANSTCSGRNPCGIPEPTPIYAVVTLEKPSNKYKEDKKKNDKSKKKGKCDKSKKKKKCKPKKKPKKPKKTCVKPPKISATSPALIPYPDLETNTPMENVRSDSTRITSVFRVRVDPCDRLWVMDSGVADILGDTKVYSKPQILVFDLNNDKLVHKYVFKEDEVQENSFFANIIVDVTKENCDRAFAYLPDLGAYAVNVFDLKNDKAWRIKHNYFHFNPLEGNYNVGGVNFQWNDGVFSIALTEPNPDNSRTGFFHAMSSNSLFKVNTFTLQNEGEARQANYSAYSLVGSKGPDSQTSASFIHEPTGVMFYTQVNKNAVYCWNSKKDFTLENLEEVASDSKTMIFPNDLKVDYENHLWVLTDKLPIFVNKGLDPKEVNHRIFVASVADAIKDTKCVP